MLSRHRDEPTTRWKPDEKLNIRFRWTFRTHHPSNVK